MPTTEPNRTEPGVPDKNSLVLDGDAARRVSLLDLRTEAADGIVRSTGSIAVSKSRGIHIDWKDGVSSDLPLAFLRDHCPCASCTGAHGTEPQRSNYSDPKPDPFQMYKPALKIDRVAPVGHYALQIFWNDGHNSGIYTWEYLRTLTPPAG